MKKLCLLLLLISFQLTAAPVRFDFVFDDPGSTAHTTGFIVFEESLVVNPGSNTFYLPNPAILDLQLTVTGSIASDGSYDINDYSEVDFNTNGGTLDFSQPLIGQATNGQPWGTTYDGNSGDFNIFPFGVGGGNKSSNRYDENRGLPVGGAPFGCFYFTICENAGGGGPQGTIANTKGGPGGPIGDSPMELQSMQPNRGTPTKSVPSLSTWSVFSLAALFLVMAGLFRRRLN